MPRYAVSSFVPDADHWCFHWPERGEALVEEVVRGMPKPALLAVAPLPCAYPPPVHWHLGARWVVLEIDDQDYAERDGRVDFRRGTVLFFGPPQEACDFLRARGLPVPPSMPEVRVAGEGEAVVVGDDAVAVADARAEAGDYGMAYAEHGEATAGRYGIAASAWGEVAAGDFGYAVTRHGGPAATGDAGLAAAGDDSRATAGTLGLALTDEFGVSTAGQRGIAICGQAGRAVAGDYGIAIAAWGGSAQAGEHGVLVIRDDGWFLKVARVGEDGIKPDTPYKLDDEGRFVEAGDDRCGTAGGGI